jgi:hypothetical protein
VRQESGTVSKDFYLSQNFPNPFNPTTNFEFQIATSDFVSLKVFDLLGREVAILVNEVRQPGIYHVTWNAARIPSGVYVYQMRAGNFTQTRRMIVIK